MRCFTTAATPTATALDLEKPGGANEVAHAGGLAKMLGLSEQLQLIFLNGCATQGQVKALLDAGVKAVIATAAPINDAMATDFAGQFYSTLAAGRIDRQGVRGGARADRDALWRREDDRAISRLHVRRC